MGYRISLKQILVIILMLLFGFIYFDKNIIKKYNEKLGLNIQHCPNFSKENRSEFVYKKLNHLLESFRTDNYELNGSYSEHKYIPGTTPQIVNDELNRLSNYILIMLNKKSIFNFVKTSYGDIKILKDKDGNKQYIYELFVRDIGHCFNLKLYVNIITYINENFFLKHTNEDSTAFEYKAFKHYPIGIPSLHQYIPTAMDVIPTRNEVLSNKSIDYPQLDDISVVYVNSIQVDNSTLVLHPRDKTNNLFLGGINDNVLENSNVCNDNTPYIESAAIRNKWPRLNSQPILQKAWPCTPESEKWDYLGVYEPPAKPTRLCPGVRSSTTQQPLTPNYWRTLATIPKNSGPNSWLFSKTNASGSVASSSSQPPP